MTFREAWFELLNGKKITKPNWSGYWVWENNTIMMHCKDGKILDIRLTDNVAYTFSFIASDDWQIFEEKSSTELKSFDDIVEKFNNLDTKVKIIKEKLLESTDKEKDKSSWISLSDQYPEENQQVIVSIIDNCAIYDEEYYITTTGCFIGYGVNGKPIWCINNDIYYDDIHILGWQLFPEPLEG